MPPIRVSELLPEVSTRLITLLKSLDGDDWHRPTSSSKRNVKDVVAHLLDGTLRRLSFQRDGYLAPNAGPASDESLLDYLNRLNAEWDIAARRLSPSVLIEFLEVSEPQLATLFASLDPEGDAIFPVAWTGEDRSQNWMDVAREYTEKWHHTQQIFVATNRPSTIEEPRLFHPCLDAFMRALPFNFRDVEAPNGTTVQVAIRGPAGGDWHLVRDDGMWRQGPDPPSTQPTATFAIDQLSAWQLFTKRQDRAAALVTFPDIETSGDEPLALHVLDMVAMMV